MSNELATLNNNQALLANNVDLTGMDGVRIRPTNIILVQNTTQEAGSARPGQLLDQLSQEVFDEITLVPLRVINNRVMFPPDSFGGPAGEPICRSSDGVYPSPFAKQPQAESCAVCPNSKWVGNKKPVCSERKKLLAIIKETSLPRYIQFSGLGVKVLMSVLETIKQDQIVVFKKTGVVYPLYGYYFTLRGVKQVSTKGVFYTPKIENLRKMQDPNEFGPLFTEYVVNRQQLEAAEDEAEASANKAISDAINTTATPVDDDVPF